MESFAQRSWDQFVEQVNEQAWSELLALADGRPIVPATEEIKNLIRRMGDYRTATEAQKKFCRHMKPSFQIDAGISGLILSQPCDDYRVIIHSIGIAYKHLHDGRWDILSQAICKLSRWVKEDLKDEGCYHHMTFCPQVQKPKERNFGEEFTIVACVYLP